MIEGLAVLSPGAMRLPGHKVMIRADSEKVRELQAAVISGGGSGHEPAHAGYIGAGMLSASALGAFFPSVFNTTISRIKWYELIVDSSSRCRKEDTVLTLSNRPATHFWCTNEPAVGS
jgi:Dak1 domain